MATIYDLAAKYESSGDPANVSSGSGDLGGISYGIYQLASSKGSVDSFISWLRNYPDPALANYGHVLAEHNVNSEGFIQTWKKIGITDPGNFSQLQNEYAKLVYFDAAARFLLFAGYDITSKSVAMQAVLLSRSVQYSAGNMVELYNEAAGRLNYQNLSYVDNTRFDYDMIANIYDFLISECAAAYRRNGLYHSPKDWVNGSYTVAKIGLRNRFINEKADALAMLA
jgi:hypothetical protein